MPDQVSRLGATPVRSHTQSATRTTARYSSSRATPTREVLDRVDVGHLAAGHRGSPKTAIVRRWARTSGQRPRTASRAGPSRISAAPPTRSSTTLPAVQPEASSALEKGPEVPKAAAEPGRPPGRRRGRCGDGCRRSASGGSVRRSARGTSGAIGCGAREPPCHGSNVRYTHDTRLLGSGVNVLFTHDTEVALVSVAALVNTMAGGVPGDYRPDTLTHGGRARPVRRPRRAGPAGTSGPGPSWTGQGAAAAAGGAVDPRRGPGGRRGQRAAGRGGGAPAAGAARRLALAPARDRGRRPAGRPDGRRGGDGHGRPDPRRSSCTGCAPASPRPATTSWSTCPRTGPDGTATPAAATGPTSRPTGPPAGRGR